MVSRVQKALEQHIEALRHIPGKNHILDTRPPKEVTERLTGLIDLLFRFIGLLVASPVDIAAALRQIAVYRLRHRRRFGKRGAGIVKIDPLHFLPSFGMESHILRLIIRQIYWNFK